MKYIIETTENGCIETLEFANGSKFTRRNKKTECGCKSLDDDFADQLEEEGFCGEIVDKAYDLLDGFFALEFLTLAEFDN